VCGGKKRKVQKMKKLMIAAAIVCAAAMSQAASFCWDAQGLKNESGSSLTADYLAFAFYKSGANVTTYTVEQAVAMVMGAEFPESLIDYAGVVDAGSVGMGPVTEAGVTGGTYEGFLVIVNSTYSDFDSAGKYAPTMYSVVEGGAQAIQEIKSAGAAATFTFAAAQQGAWQSVPEPTSGLLLLLGVAGLALRRKRA
jgi:hypothetical protein